MKSITTSFIAFAVTLVCANVLAQGVKVPRTPSPAAKVSQTIGISTVSISYSRPSVKTREVWGKLVPYGWNVQSYGAGKSAPWRAGANENTVIEFSHDATVEGKPVPAGSYGLFFVINQDNVVYEKDLGEQTPTLALRITEYNPDESWSEVQLPESDPPSRTGPLGSRSGGE